MVGKYERAKLKELKLEKTKSGRYLLNVTYRYEDEHGIYELNIPYIDLLINQDKLPDFNSWRGTLSVDLGFGMCGVALDSETDAAYTIQEIEKKTRKMTLAEIEKQLGHKVELVSE